jgi:hypothetical protein
MQVVPGFVFPSFYKPTGPDQSLSPPIALLSLIILGIILCGVIKDILRERSFQHFLLLFYMAITLAWPSVWSAPRFLVPILPFIFLYFFEGINFKIGKTVPIVIVLGVLAAFASFQQIFPQIPKNLNAMHSYVNGNKTAGYSLDWVRYYGAADWVKSYTPSNSVVLCRKPNLFYLASNRKAFCYPMTYNHEKVLDSVKKADYIIIDSFFWTGTTGRYLVPALRDKLDWFKVAYVTDKPQTFVLEVSEEAKQ